MAAAPEYDDVISISAFLQDELDTFLVGGQATLTWAWIFRNDPRLAEIHSGLTTKDIDYYGRKETAQRMADELGGVCYVPPIDHMNTPDTAVVDVTINGRPLRIDFIHSMLGVAKKDILKGALSVTLEYELDAGMRDVEIRIMHPVVCLKSRIGNIAGDGAARRHREAPAKRLRRDRRLLRRYGLGRRRLPRGQAMLQGGVRVLRSHGYGRRAHTVLKIDLLGLLSRHIENERIDSRYRHLVLRKMCAKLASRR